MRKDYMNKSQRIYFDPKAVDNDKYLKIKLEQDIDCLEFLTLSIDTKDIYQDFNADYGVLVGRVIANEGIGIPNAKISIFIPLTDTDAENSEIYDIYPYKTPRDKNNDGKRYNLLPRVSEYKQITGTYKPKQPFGSFPIKPEMVTNISFLNVYKKYYKYTAVTNEYGDYMIFGAPIGTQTVHMSVDITDIGEYSMTPAGMIVAGYPANLFTDNGKSMKSSKDLNDLPNIETQEITVDIISFWGDDVNFEIGITRQDFRIRAQLKSDFVIFGTSITMGDMSLIGDPDRNTGNYAENNSFYYLSNTVQNNIDIRTYRTADLNIRVFSYLTTIDIADIETGNVDPINDIYELGKEEYFEYQKTGDFVLSIPCNRKKIIKNDIGNDVVVDNNSSFGVFTEFYGMILIEYPDTTELTIAKTYNHDFRGNNSAIKIRGRLKIPQTHALQVDSNSVDNDLWRKEYMKFVGGEFYSVAQFLPTKEGSGTPDTIDADSTENKLPITYSYSHIGGTVFKVAGVDEIVKSQQPTYDEINYIIPPSSASTYFRYDFPANAKKLDSYSNDEFFGAQWINLCLVFPQIVWANGAGPNRGYKVADVFFNGYTTTTFLNDNTRDIFAGINNDKWFLKGDAYRTAFIKIPKTEISNLNQISPKGLNINKWNRDTMEDVSNSEHIIIDSNNFMYQIPSSETTNGRQYDINAWDCFYPYSDNNPTAYVFRGLYENDCIQALFDLNLL